MEIKSTDKQTFQLRENGTYLGEIVYENLFFLKAEIKTSDSESYKIRPVGTFGQSLSVTQNETEIARLHLSWGGEIVIAFQEGEEYILKLKGIFSNTYVLENKNKEKLLQLDAQFNWRDFNYRYAVSYTLGYDKSPENLLVVLLAAYAANLFIATLSGANAGMV
jgi:hypothetical protein